MQFLLIILILYIYIYIVCVLYLCGGLPYIYREGERERLIRLKGALKNPGRISLWSTLRSVPYAAAAVERSGEHFTSNPEGRYRSWSITNKVYYLGTKLSLPDGYIINIYDLFHAPEIPRLGR